METKIQTIEFPPVVETVTQSHAAVLLDYVPRAPIVRSGSNRPLPDQPASLSSNSIGSICSVAAALARAWQSTSTPAVTEPPERRGGDLSGRSDPYPVSY